MTTLRRRSRALVAGLLLPLAAALAIGANIALLDQGASPAQPVGQLGRDLGRTRPAAPPPSKPVAQARPQPATAPPAATQAPADENDSAHDLEDEPEGWDDDD